jgi:hypothetical protein
LLLRVLRLNCLTADYAPLWEELYDPTWQDDRWTDPDLTRSALGDVGPKWTMDTPLRRDQDRWQALVEIDALAALMLGLTAEQLCAMYRTQFAVLRKYEYKMVFDAEGRKICAIPPECWLSTEPAPRPSQGWRPPEGVEEHLEPLRAVRGRPTSVDWLRPLHPTLHPSQPRGSNPGRYECISAHNSKACSIVNVDQINGR